MDPVTEPLRVRGWVALAVSVGLSALLMWALDVPLKPAVATIVVHVATSVGGIELARRQVTPTATAEQLAQERAEAAFTLGAAHR